MSSVRSGSRLGRVAPAHGPSEILKKRWASTARMQIAEIARRIQDPEKVFTGDPGG